MKSTTFTIDIPKPKGWIPNKKQPKKLFLFSVMQRFSVWYEQIACKHKEWDCDNQIRVIECKKCKKRAWIKDYRSLF